MNDICKTCYSNENISAVASVFSPSVAAKTKELSFGSAGGGLWYGATVYSLSSYYPNYYTNSFDVMKTQEVTSFSEYSIATKASQNNGCSGAKVSGTLSAIWDGLCDERGSWFPAGCHTSSNVWIPYLTSAGKVSTGLSVPDVRVQDTRLSGTTTDPVRLSISSYCKDTNR